MGKRGPGAGVRQARTPSEAAQWLRLFEALAASRSRCVLPHLGLRITDAVPLGDVALRASASLRRILATTGDDAMLDDVNGVLAAVYAELQHRGGARLARCVFVLAADGFPGPGERELVATWDRALGAQQDGGLAVDCVPAAKRDVVVAVLGHYVAATTPLDALAASDGDTAEARAHLDWLLALARWRRFARVRRTMAKVLTPGERRHLATAVPGAGVDRG